MHRLCSRKFHRLLKWTISEENDDSLDEVIGDEKSVIIDKHCEGYCWKNMIILSKYGNLENDTIDTIIYKLAFTHDVESNFSERKRWHHLKWFNIWRHAAERCLPSNMILFNKYNNRFKKILRLNNSDIEIQIINELSSDEQGIVTRMPHLWYIALFCKMMLNRADEYNDLTGDDPDLPRFVDGVYDRDNMKICLSFVQRKSSAIFVSPSKKEIRLIDRLIKICCKTFTTKNMTKLISYHI